MKRGSSRLRKVPEEWKERASGIAYVCGPLGQYEQSGSSPSGQYVAWGKQDESLEGRGQRKGCQEDRSKVESNREGKDDDRN